MIYIHERPIEFTGEMDVTISCSAREMLAAEALAEEISRMTGQEIGRS